MITHLCPISKSKLNLHEAIRLTVSTYGLATVQTSTGKVDRARKFKRTTAARVIELSLFTYRNSYKCCLQDVFIREI